MARKTADDVTQRQAHQQMLARMSRDELEDAVTDVRQARVALLFACGESIECIASTLGIDESSVLDDIQSTFAHLYRYRSYTQ